MAIVYTFRGKLVLLGSLHIGSGSGDEHSDAAIVRTARGVPYIPGSSLRGAFRAAVERLAPAILGLPPTRDMDDLEDLLRNQLEDQREDKQISILNEELRSVERLFGTTYWASPLTIRDLMLDEDEPVAGEVRHGVGIDRDTGAARDQIKYDFEVLPRGYSFHFLMHCEMVPEYQQEWERLLAIGLRLLEQGELPLGGRLARGVGQVQLTDLEVFMLDTDDRKALLAALRDSDGTAWDGQRQPAGWTLHALKQV